MTTSTMAGVESGPIVMVDDDEADTYLIERAHRKAGLGHDLITFGSGADFLAYIESLDPAHDDLPSVVILDINMPGMNGFEVLAKLRSLELFADVPVVMFYTNSDHPNDRTRAEQAGCRLQEKFTGRQEGIEFLKRLVS